MQKLNYDIIIFFLVISGLIVTMIIFIISIIHTYGKKQKHFGDRLEALKLHYEKTILTTRLEIQEQTFQHISREIHDNINLSLTLAKLNLNTIEWDNQELIPSKIESSVNLLSKSIKDLSDVSKGLNADQIIQNGLVKAIEEELFRLKQVRPYKIDFKVEGNPIYLNGQKELIIFRIIQEAFNNIVKHADTNDFFLLLDYKAHELLINIEDHGIGFDFDKSGSENHAGLKNMQSRAKILGGTMNIKTEMGKGTSLIFKIPYVSNEN